MFVHESMARQIKKGLDKNFPFHVTKAIKKKSKAFSVEEEKIIARLTQTNLRGGFLSLSNKKHIQVAATGVSLGAPMIYHFGNFIAIAAHPHPKAVEYVNITKGRPKNQTGSITTVRKYIQHLFDWSKVPKEINRQKLMKLIDDLYKLGPFGFRGPAAKNIPNHLTKKENGIRTVQLITPGYRCLSNRLVKKILKITRTKFLYATSPNLSHYATGRTEEPAHYRMKELQKDFKGKPGYFIVAHRNENAVQMTYPKHDLMSTSILSFHKVVKDSKGKVFLILERHGSLAFNSTRKVALVRGFGLVKADSAKKRLIKRKYRN